MKNSKYLLKYFSNLFYGVIEMCFNKNDNVNIPTNNIIGITIKPIF